VQQIQPGDAFVVEELEFLVGEDLVFQTEGIVGGLLAER